MFPFLEVPQPIYNDSLDGFRAKVYCNEKIYDMKGKKDTGHLVSIEIHIQVSLCSLLSMMGQNKKGHFFSNEKYNKICEVFLPREAH